MTNNFQQEPYLRTQRQFPNDDVKTLSNQMDTTYIDIASKVNARTIGIFPVNFSIVTGEQWYVTGGNQKQQTLRKVYSFGAIAPGMELDIPINISNFTSFTRIYGTVITNNGPDYRPLPYIDPTKLTVGMALLVGPVLGENKIRILLGVDAPAVTSGTIVLEWLSNF